MAFAALAPALISGATSLIGAKMTSDANGKAARLQQIQNAMAQQRREAGLVEQKGNVEEQQRILDAAQEAQLGSVEWGYEGSSDAILAAAADAADNLNNGAKRAEYNYRTGEWESTDELRKISQTTAPGMAMLRQVIGESGQLTPYQRQGLEDARKAVQGQIAGSSIAGSGRTAAALMKNVESDYALKAAEANRQQAITAANTLAQADMAARGRVATNKSTLGQQLGATATTLGQNLAQNSSEAGGRLSNIFADTGARRAGIMGQTAQGQSSNIGALNSHIGAVTGANANTDEATGKAQANAATATGASNASTAGAVGAALADALRGSKYNQQNDAIKSQVSGTPAASSGSWW